MAPYLAEQGHQVTNADLVPLGHPDVADLRVDLTDAGETWSALAPQVVRWQLEGRTFDTGFRGDDKDVYEQWVQALGGRA